MVNGAPYQIGEHKVPKSCCLEFDPSERNQCRQNPNNFNVTGCIDKLEKSCNENKTTFLISGLVTLIVMVYISILTNVLIAILFFKLQFTNCHDVFFISDSQHIVCIHFIQYGQSYLESYSRYSRNT